MRTLPLLALLAFPLLVATACTQPHQVSRSGGQSSESGGVGVTGGGFLVESGRPTLFYGTLLEDGRRTFTYLLLVRGFAPEGWSQEQGVDGSSTASGDELATDSTLRVDDRTLQASFRATVRDGKVGERRLTLGTQAVPQGQWLFLLDLAQPAQGPRPHAAEMPELPVDIEELADSTEAYVDRLAAQDAQIAAFLDG